MSNNLVQTISLKDNGYSQGVKSAKQALEELGRQNGVVNNSFRNTSKELNSAKKFYGQLKTEYDRLSEDAKRSEFGKAMHRQLETTKADLQSLYEQTARTRKELQDMQDQANKKVSGGKGGFSFKQMGGDMLDKFGMGQLKKLGGGKLGGGAVAGGILVAAGVAFKEAAEAYIPFESALSNLQAITGVSSKELENFKTKIKETGVETSKAFTEVTDAYTKVGSAMPELLKSPDALDAVTRAAITLSKAARMDLDTAINSLTGIMNQFGASASEADRYVNVLAAGAKEGSAGIEYLAQALDKCGTSLATTNMSVEEGTALLEVLAKKIPDASTAGTNLRNILIKMSQAQDKYNPKVVGMSQALQNLQPKIKDTAFMVKMFGSENVNAAITLAQAVNTYDDLTKKVTGTNEAFKQAGVQTDNFESAMKRLDTSWNNFKASLLDTVKPMTKCVNLMADLLGLLTRVNKTPITIGGKEVEKINKQYGDANAYQEKATLQKQKDAYNLRKHALEEEYNKANQLYKAYEKGAKDAKRGKVVQQQQAALAAGQLLKRDALKEELDAYIQSAKDFFYPNRKTPTITETTTTTDTTKKTKTKSPKEIYDEKVADIEARLVNGYIKEKKAIEEKIAATQQYIVALQNLKKKTKQDEQVLTSLKAQEKALEKSLIKATDEEIVSDALENYNDTIKKLDRQRQNGWITESEYQSQYISAIKALCKAYDKVTDMSDKLIKEISEKQKEIKDFELKQSQNKAIAQYLSTYNDVSRIYNGGSTERQAPANSAYKAHETAYINLIQKAKNIDFDNILSNTDYKPTQADLDWLKDYKQYLTDNVNLLGQMYEDVQDLNSAVKHAKKLTLVNDIQTDIDNILEGNSTEQVSDLVKKYKEDLKSIDFELEFDENEFLDKIKELGTQTAIPIHIEPTYDTVDELSEIVEKFAPDAPDYKALKGFKKKFDKDIENLLNYVSNWQFPDAETVFGQGDASNYSIVNNPSYYKLNKKYTEFNQGNGRLNDNLMDDRITQKMNEDLDKYLQKYREIEELYVKMRQESEEKGLDFTFENSQIDQELSDLESKIATLHDQIQDRLTFQLRIEGAQDALDGLGGFANIGSSLASLPDTLDNISDSSNDAAAAFQYFGVIVGSIQDIIDAIKISMEVYKGIQDLFTASTVAQDLALKDKTASQATEMALSEAAVATKTTEAVANKTLESSLLDLAAAEIFAAHASIPFAGVPIATSNVGAMMGTMAGVHATSASLQAFANGGIVGGDSFSGDKTLIRANKGEMILNNQQQGNLFSLLDGVVGTNQGGGKVKFEISGDNLVGVLNNHSRMKSKVGNRLR